MWVSQWYPLIVRIIHPYPVVKDTDEIRILTNECFTTVVTWMHCSWQIGPAGAGDIDIIWKCCFVVPPSVLYFAPQLLVIG